MYDFQPLKVKKFLEDHEVERACIQLPSGLRPYIGEIRKFFDETEASPLFLSDSCFGSCFLPDIEAKSIGCDALIHYGHSDMSISTSLPTLYVEVRAEVDSLEPLEDIVSRLEGSNWGLTSTVQYAEYLPEIRIFLKERGIESLIGEPGPRSKYPGQILGCDWGSAKSLEDKVDGFIYFGDGDFHPKGIALFTGKPVVSVRLESGDFEILDFDINRFMKKRYAMIEKAKSAKSFGILVSSMRGQMRLNLARSIEDKLIRNGYEAFTLVMREITPIKLQDYRLEAYINTACPRIPIEDSESYDRPILTPFEAKIVLNEATWGSYKLDKFGLGD